MITDVVATGVTTTNKISSAVFRVILLTNKLRAWRYDMPRPSPPHVGASAPPSRCNVAVVSHAQYVLTVTTAPASHVSRRWVKRPGDLDLCPFDLESGARVTCDVGYLCANFGLPRPLCSRHRPDVCNRRQTKASLNAPPIRGGV